MTYLTVPIADKDIGQAGRQIKSAKLAGAEMLELRTDYLQELTVGLAESLIVEAKTVDLPIIVTCRDVRQGGAKDWPGQLRLDVLVAAVKAGADFIDCEFENFTVTDNQQKIKSALAENPRTRLILSAHNFKGKFKDIKKLYDDILTCCPDAIPKLIYTANHINDCFEAYDLLRNRKGDAVIFAMGKAGLSTRIIAKKLGLFVTFASLNEAAATAPGQITINEFKELYRCDSINADTELFGVIGAPVAHSLSPHIHNACFAASGLNKLYLPLLVEGGKDEFEKFLNNIFERDWLNFKGFSVTIPHKTNALNYVKAIGGTFEPLAEKIGAVNTLTIKNRESRIENRESIRAYNTDYTGAMDAIRTKIDNLKDLPIAVIGAGGVARAIVAGLTDAGAKITIYNRTVSKAERLAVEFGCKFAPLSELSSLKADLLINCTSIGMHPNVNQSPVPQECLKKGMVVFDTVYNLAETLFLKQAKAAGAKTIDGLSMFINQAAAQFKLFTGQAANTDLMRENCYGRF